MERLTNPVAHPLTERLLAVMTQPTGTSSAGYPYLEQYAWETFRDTIPHILGMGVEVLQESRALADAASRYGLAEAENMERAARVIRQVVFTATVTAPPDLWLMRQVLGTFEDLGLLERLGRGEALYPHACRVGSHLLDARELEIDLHFLLSRGVVEQYDTGFRISGHPFVRDIVEKMSPVLRGSESTRHLWQRYFEGDTLEADDEAVLLELGQSPPKRTDFEQTHWVPTIDEIELGFRLVPLVLAMRQCGLTDDPTPLLQDSHQVGQGAARILKAAGWIKGVIPTATGERGLARAAGPFGIIEAYDPYMQHGSDLLQTTGADVWVQRGENVGASQDANRTTFERANDAIDRFCEERSFAYSVYIEHAIGRGEATRQRFARSGDEAITYVGADLEDDAIDAALAEQKKGKLPANMVFVRNADIGDPVPLLDAMREEGIDPHGAVMIVGNGFHEVRDQTDERMVEVFRGYHDAGVILVFTEENALSIDDLRATAFNTYHAGFKYVHEKSGQGLRPAHPRPIPRLGQPLRAPWSECAEKAGYERLDAYCSRSRTIYPYTPRSGVNPSVSVSHFMVPASIAKTLS